MKRRKEKKLIEKEVIRQKPARGEGVVKSKNIYATFPFKCKKCGYNKAEIIDEGVKYSDEAEVILLQCGKCEYTKRVGGKTS